VVGIVVVVPMLSAGGWFLNRQAENSAHPGVRRAVVAAELAVRANPDLEVVESDPEAGTITIRNKTTGEVVTWNAEDVESGKFTVTTKEGTATFGGAAGVPANLPAWVPTYPDGDVQGSYDAISAEGRSAAFTVTTSNRPAEVLAFYESRLEAAGLTAQKSTFEAGSGVFGGTVIGTTQDEKRTVTVMVSADEGQTSAVVSFTEKP